MLINLLIKLLFLLVLLTFPLVASATESYDEHQLKAAITYNLAKFVKFPPEVFSAEADPFVICVLGRDDVVDGFKSLEDRFLGTHPIHIVATDSYSACHESHVLYLSKMSSHDVEEVLVSVANAPILTVSDIDEFAILGGMINLVEIDNNIRFAINLDAANTANMHISSKLNSLAIEVIRKKGNK